METDITINLYQALARGSEEELAALANDAPAVERGELLYAAGDHWRRAGDLPRAEQHLLTALTLDAEAGASARVALADVRFEQGREDEARALLCDLKAIDANSFWPYHRAAMRCEKRGQHQDCLEFADLAFSRLDADSLILWQEGADADDATPILAIRRRARQALGLRSDDLDDSVEVILHMRCHFLNLGGSLSASTPIDVQLQFWPRGELVAAHAAWPDLVTRTELQHTTQYRMSEDGMFRVHRGRIMLVPFTVVGLSEFARKSGRDPVDKDVRAALEAELVRNGHGIAWPPARNESCWCGSTLKYKKCCGRPAPE